MEKQTPEEFIKDREFYAHGLKEDDPFIYSSHAVEAVEMARKEGAKEERERIFNDKKAREYIKQAGDLSQIVMWAMYQHLKQINQ